jgi:hypothetical protein
MFDNRHLDGVGLHWSVAYAGQVSVVAVIRLSGLMVRGRTRRKNDRTSSTKVAGSSRVGKCPPCSSSFHHRMFV